MNGHRPLRIRWVYQLVLAGNWLDGRMLESRGDLTFLVNGTVVVYGRAFGRQEGIDVRQANGAWRAIRLAGSRRITIHAGGQQTHFEYWPGIWTHCWYEVAPRYVERGWWKRARPWRWPGQILRGALRLLALLPLLLAFAILAALVCGWIATLWHLALSAPHASAPSRQTMPAEDRRRLPASVNEPHSVQFSRQELN